MNSNSVRIQILCTEAMYVHGSVCIHEGGGRGGRHKWLSCIYVAVIMMLFGISTGEGTGTTIIEIEEVATYITNQ